MVRVLQPEESVVSRFESLVKARSTAVEIGVLIGKWGVGSKDVLLAVAPTPPQEGANAVELQQVGSAAKASSSKKSSGTSFQATLDQDWISEHANQVNRMLPGGISILGLYLLAPEGAFSAAASQLAAVVAAIQSDTAALAAGCPEAAAQGSAEGMLLLHIDSATARLTCKACPATATSAAAAASSLKPCEVKPGKLGNNLVKLSCRHNVVLAGAAKPQQELQQLLQAAVGQEAARIVAAAALVQGSLYYPSSSGSSNGGSNSAPQVTDSVTGDSAEVQLFVSAACCTPPTTSSSSSSAGGFTLHGAVQGIAYVYRRDPVTKALAEVKADLCKSLRVRYELLADEVVAAAEDADAAAGATGGGDGAGGKAAAAAPVHPLLLTAPASKAVAVALPRRVLLPWVAGLQVCDHLLPTPGADLAAGHEEACEHAAELLSLPDVQPSQVVDLEAPAALEAQPSSKKAVAGSAVAAGGQGASSGSGLPCSSTVLAGGAAGVAVAALAVALALFNTAG